MPDYVLPVTADNLLVATGMYLSFLAFLFILARWAPGIRREGLPLADGTRRPYKLSGLVSFLVTTGLVGVGAAFGYSLTPVLEYFWSLLVVANLVSLIWTTQLFVTGRRSADYPATVRSTMPRWLHDLWFGPVLNPMLGRVDMKMFAYQPSLIGLGVVVAAFGFRQWETQGTLTPQMFLFQGFWWLYLFTHYIREDLLLSTWDIIAEHFGFMLVWGDLVYVTFFYSIGGWFLVEWTEPISAGAMAGLVLLHGLGHWIFRGANWQKDRYKRDPQTKIWGKPAETLGGRLLISGWWGIGRKINYTGEILVYLSFALCAGFQSWIPYVLPISLVALLVHRAWRDDRKCREKYGELWDSYCARARFKIIPFIY